MIRHKEENIANFIISGVISIISILGKKWE